MKWKKEGGEGKKYKEKRMEYKKLYDRKEKNRRWEKRTTEVKRETEV